MLAFDHLSHGSENVNVGRLPGTQIATSTAIHTLVMNKMGFYRLSVL